ncbi:helix-turn-helix domain-containing protein, partial [Patescibacteria group bacterium]|nr:helix-turn-helix domain-containing protein [Patescibacteria group bacterium]
MLTAGEALRQKRLELKLTFTQVSDTTKIPLPLLKALEKSQFDELPGFPFLKGMVQNYAKELGLDPAKIVAVFKRDYDQQRHKVVPVALAQSLGPAPLTSFLERPLTLFLGGVILLTGLVGWSLLRVYQPPRLEINAPQNEQTAISPV